MPSDQLQSVMERVQVLAPSDQMRLIEQIENLLGKANQPVTSRPLVYGEFHGESGELSSEEDFQIAEWYPTERDLNGP